MISERSERSIQMSGAEGAATGINPNIRELQKTSQLVNKLLQNNNMSRLKM
jgi:hypothetical protein